MEYPVNQRVRAVMEAIGLKAKPHQFGRILLGEGERTDKVKNVYNDVNAASTEILALITTKIVNEKGQRPNGHWLLTGEGEMFLEDNSSTNTRELEEILKDLDAFRTLAVQNAQTILNLSAGGRSKAAQEA